MIKPKERKCNMGNGPAAGFEGCGAMTYYHKYGLCKSECYPKFIMETEAGQILLHKAMIQGRSAVKRVQKKKDDDVREGLKTLGEYEAEAKKSFQKWVRLRDAERNCASCDGNDKDLWDGGHFKKAEIYSGVIFDERNCHKQCRKCNRFLGGNELNYRERLVIRFGLDHVVELERYANATRQYKWTREELIEKKAEYDRRIKEFK